MIRVSPRASGIDAGPVLSAAINAALAAGNQEVVLSYGVYNIQTPIVITLTSSSVSLGTLLRIVGEGSNATQLTWQGTTGAPITVSGIGFRLEGVGFYGTGLANTFGLNMTNTAFFSVEDVGFFTFQYGLLGIGILSGAFRDCSFLYNQGGMVLTGISNGAVSAINAVTFDDCHIGLNSLWGVTVHGSNALNFRGGSIENNGTPGAAQQMYGLSLDSPGTYFGTALNLEGVYFEGNTGNADLILTNGSQPAGAVANISGCGFLRAGTRPNTNSILALGNDPFSLNFDGCSWSTKAGWVPSANTPIFATSGPNIQVHTRGCTSDSPIETPSWFNSG